MSRSVPLCTSSLTRLACVINTTFSEKIYSRWCCIDRLSWQALSEVKRMDATALLPAWLWLKNHRRPADSLRLEVDSHLHAVGDLDEGNAPVHPVVLPVE